MDNKRPWHLRLLDNISDAAVFNSFNAVVACDLNLILPAYQRGIYTYIYVHI